MISYIAGLTNQMISYIVTFLIAYKKQKFEQHRFHLCGYNNVIIVIAAWTTGV